MQITQFSEYALRVLLHVGLHQEAVVTTDRHLKKFEPPIPPLAGPAGVVVGTRRSVSEIRRPKFFGSNNNNGWYNRSHAR